MKCFLHIGTEKTATTTIQKFFNINRKRLLEKGFIYTKTAGKINNRALSVAAYSLQRRDDFTKDYGLDSDEKLSVFQNNTIRNLTDEIEELRKIEPYHSVIFSSEHFQSRLTDIKEIERLKEIILSFGVADISVIVYLRRPAELASSLYSTAIKTGIYMENPPSPDEPYWNNVCNHKNTIEKFSSVFGKSSIIPRLFDKNEFKNGLIIDDILNIIGISNSNSFEVPLDANKSLSLIGIHLLKRLNKKVPTWIENKPNHLRANLLPYIEEHFSDSKYTMPSSLYTEFDLAFSDSNEWVREVYFPGKERIFSEKIPEETTLNISEEELDRIADFIANIWKDKQRRIISLQNEIDA